MEALQATKEVENVLGEKKTIQLGNYKTLIHLHNELEGARSSVFYVLLRGRINEFYKKYFGRLQSITEKIESLSREHFEYEIFEGNERVKMEQIVDEGKPKLENGEPFRKWQEILLPGKTKEQYIEALEAYLSTPLDISI